MSALVLVRVDSADRTTPDALLHALARVETAKDLVMAWTAYRAATNAESVAVMGAFADADAAQAFALDPAVHRAIDVAGSSAARSVHVFEEVERRVTAPRQLSGWLREALRVAALPGGIPPGRSRLEPLRYPTS